MTKNSDIPQARSRDLRLVFTRNHAAEYELSTIEVNGLKATASKKRDKRNGDSFQWKPSSGIAALSLFFVETWLHLQRGTPTVEHLRRPVPLEVIPIWNAPLNSERELSIEHPLAKIRVNLIRNRLRSSLYLYRLFYQNELNTHQVSFLELNQSQAPNEPAVVRTIEQADRIDSSYRQEFDELIYLGCLLIRRSSSDADNGACTAYFCMNEERRIDISISIIDDPAVHHSRPISQNEGEAIRSSLQKHFPSSETTNPPNPSSPTETLETESTESPTMAAKPKLGNQIPHFAAIVLFFSGTLLGLFLSSIFTEKSSTQEPTNTNGSDPLPSTSSQSKEQPSLASVKNKQVQVFSQSGRLMWARQFPGWILDEEALLEDLDGDGTNEIIIPVAGIDTKTGGSLLAFSSTGAPYWEYSLRANSPFASPSSGKFAIREVIADDLYDTGKKQLILLMYAC